MSECDIDLLTSRVFDETSLPEEAQKSLRLFATNKEKDEYNDKILRAMDVEGTTSVAHDATMGSGSASVKRNMLEISAKTKCVRNLWLTIFSRFENRSYIYDDR